MDLFGEIRNAFVFFLSLGQLFGKPVVVSASGYMENAAAGFYGITIFFMTVTNGNIQIALPYL